MQAIARVNRVFKDKPGGLIVDYLGIVDELKRALATYSEKDRHDALIPAETAIALMKEKHKLTQEFFEGISYQGWRSLKPGDLVELLQRAQNAVTGDEKTKLKFLKAGAELTKAHSLAIPSEESLRISDDLYFFQSDRGESSSIRLP